MKKFATLLPLLFLFLITVLRVHAQDDIGGCADSPENPTLVLGLIVGAAGVAYPRLRSYLRNRSRRDQ